MNILKAIENTRFLSDNEVTWFVNDVMLDYEETSVKNFKYRNLLAWFLRNYMYLPYSKISDALGYYGGKAHSSFEAELTVMVSKPKPFSLCGDMKDQLELLEHTANVWYECGANIYLDRIESEELEEALLYSASKACGFSDKKSNYNAGQRLVTTPASSQLLNLKEVSEMISSNKKTTDILSVFEIIKND